MLGWLTHKLSMQRYRSAWFVGSIFALLITNKLVAFKASVHHELPELFQRL